MKKYWFILLNISFFCATMFAQTVDTARFKLTFEPQLPTFQKINQQATIIDTAKEVIQFNYYITSQRQDITFQPSPIKAGKMSPDIVEKMYRNYLKVGFGYPITPLVEFSVHNTNNTKYSYGLNFHHFSSWMPPVGKNAGKYAYAPTSDSRIHLFFTRFYKNQTLYSSIGYNHELAHLYGFSKDLHYNERFYQRSYRDSLKNDFHHLKGEIGVRSNYTLDDKRLKQDVRLNYDFLYTKHKDMENHVGITSYFAYDARFIKVSGSQNYRIGFNFDYYNQRFNEWENNFLRTENSVKIELVPTVNFTLKEYHILAGLGIPLIHSNGKTRCPIYPVAEVQLGLISGILNIYAGVDGKTEYNGIKELIYENPYLKPQLDTLLFSRNQISIYGGIKGNLIKKLNYHISARYSYVQDMHFFMIDTLAPLHNQFDVVYDDVNCLNVCVNLNWEVIDHLYLNLDANYWGYYALKKLEHAWYKPAWEIAFNGKYTLKEKYVFDFNFKLGFDRRAYVPYINNEVAGQPIQFKSEKMSPLLDFGVGFEYLINKQFSAFAQINNITGIGKMNYAKYYDFNSFGINVLAGITYSFGNESLKKKPSKKH